MRIIIRGEEYDIDEFLKDHPGGSHVFKDGQDQTIEFDNAHHSPAALKMMERYRVSPARINRAHESQTNRTVEHNIGSSRGETDTSPQGPQKTPIEEDLITRVRNKLITNRDTLFGTRHLHKTFGILNAIFCILFIHNSFINGCTGKLTLSPFMVSIMATTALIPGITAALTFDVGKEISDNIVGINQMFIGHNLGFTCRSVLNLYACCYFGENSKESQLIGCIGAILFGQLADFVSERYNVSRNQTTVQNLVNCSSKIPGWVIFVVKNIYIIAQLYFTAWCCKPSISGQFVGMYGLLFTAFLSTLNRSGLIDNTQWNLLYLLIYVIGGMTVSKRDAGEQIKAAIVCFVLRILLRVKKIYVWAMYAMFVLLPNPLGGVVFVLISVLIGYLSIGSDDVDPTIVSKMRNMLFDPVRVSTQNRVTDRTNIIGDKWLLGIKLATTDDNHKPGMYYNLYCDEQKRPYTPIRSNNGVLEFYIKTYSHNRSMSKALIDRHSVGSQIQVRGPFGRKYFKEGVIFVDETEIKTRNILFVSCGTGMTPFLAMSNHMEVLGKSDPEETVDPYRVLWIHAGDDERSKLPPKVDLFDSNRRIGPHTLNSYMLSDQTVFVCGPEPFVRLVKQTFEDAIVW